MGKTRDAATEAVAATDERWIAVHPQWFAERDALEAENALLREELAVTNRRTSGAMSDDSSRTDASTIATLRKALARKDEALRRTREHLMNPELTDMTALCLAMEVLDSAALDDKEG